MNLIPNAYHLSLFFDLHGSAVLNSEFCSPNTRCRLRAGAKGGGGGGGQGA